jgi:putative ABC transport system substrate-binding protein
MPCLPIGRVRAHCAAGILAKKSSMAFSSAVGTKPFIDAFRDRMRALGYVEPATLIRDERYADGHLDRLPALATELLHGRPDVMLASTTPGALAAKNATATVPVVFVLVADPVGNGIVPSLARPGGNVTGITTIIAELTGKRLELLKEVVPGLTRVAVFVNPESANAPPQIKSAEEAARRLGIEVKPIVPIRSPGELEKAFEAATKAYASAAIRMIDPLVLMLRKETAALVARHRLPVIYPAREDVEAGGLIAYGASAPEQFRQAAGLVDKVLKGVKAAELPVEQPTKFELVINMRTAKALGLTIPPSMLLRADQVIE